MLKNSFRHANSERSKENEIYVYDTSIVNDIFKAITSNYEISNSGNSLTFKAAFELNMDTLTETWTTLHPNDQKDSTDEYVFMSLPENSKVEWNE